LLIIADKLLLIGQGFKCQLKLIKPCSFMFSSPVGSFPPSPINVSFSSVNLRNVLHWLPGHDTPNDTHFTVQYLKWRAVRQCTVIVRTWCDLSAQTSDLDDGYYARVRSVVRKKSSKWTGLQRRFDPKEESKSHNLCSQPSGTDSERVFLQHHYVLQKGFFKYRLLSYNTKYCFSAQSRLVFMPIECQRSAWFCITTAQGIIDLKL
uniref:Fibronectin type-III domain-containing protein n=1 Tax=Oryzias sinensis TaxID=183150 RepID=A0A8C7ZK27_9TELE